MPKKEQPTKNRAAWGGAFDAFGKAFNQVKANPAPAVLFITVYFLVTLLQISTLGTSTKDQFALISYEGLVYLLFLLALPVYALAIADRKRISLGDFMNFRARKYFFVLFVSILYGLIVLLSLLLLIIPAIWTVAWFALCILLAADRGLSPITALKESRRLVKNHKGKVWGIIGVTVLFSFAVGLVSSVPVIGQLVGSVLSSLIAVVSTGALAILLRWAQAQAK